MALNMYDELKHKGDKLDIKQLGHLLGIPVCPTVSRNGEGIPELFDTVIKIYENPDTKLARHIHINHGKELEKSIVALQHPIGQNRNIRKYCPEVKHVFIIFNPADVTALTVLIHSGLRPCRVSSLAALDSTRLQTNLAKEFGVRQSDVENAFTYGGHGESMAVFMSKATICGTPMASRCSSPCP